MGMSETSRIVASVDRRFDEQIDFLETLVRFRSLRNREGEAQDFLQAQLERRRFAVSRFRTDGSLIGKHPAFSPATVDYCDSWNVVGRRNGDGGGARSLAFNSHIDVVPAGSADRWTQPPFTPRRDGDWLHGRGAGDMKAGLAASVFALDAIADAGFALRGDVQVHSVVEEETTGNGSATAFVRGFTADAIVSPEPTRERLVRANVGVLKFRLGTRGRPAHPFEPEAGRSAIDLMMRLLAHLRVLERKWIEQKRGHASFEGIANPISLTIGTIAGGDWLANIPSDCEAEGRIGFYPGETPSTRAAELEAFLEEIRSTDPAFAAEGSISLAWVGVMHAGYELAEGSDAERCLRGAHMAVNDGKELSAFVMPAYLDAAIFSVHGGIPSLVYGPVAEDIHGIDERVSLTSLRRVTKALALFAADWCGLRPM
jgi:acetylornithine deacetylase